MEINRFCEALYYKCKSVSEMLSAIYGSKRQGITKEWETHKQELDDLYSSPDINEMIKSRMIQ
jgi:hypothetical protein